MLVGQLFSVSAVLSTFFIQNFMRDNFIAGAASLYKLYKKKLTILNDRNTKSFVVIFVLEEP